MEGNDYYPFGMSQPGRKYAAGSGYRYGFNGKENDKEVKGEGNQQDYGMRIYDPRLGRFLSVDPLTKTFPYYSPFHYASNSPIKFKDLDGGEPLDYLENWIPQSLFEMKSGAMVGDGSYMQVWVQSQPQLGMVDVKMVYDKWTKKCWFIHSDDQGNYYYLKNANNESRALHIAPGKNKNFVIGGEFVKFETQNAIQSRLGSDLATTMATSVFVAVGAVIGIEAGAGISTMWQAYKRLSEANKNERLLGEGNKDDKNGFSKAGRALQKHSNRKGSKFDRPEGNTPKNYNEAGKKELDNILRSENSV